MLSADFILSTPVDEPERVFQSTTPDGVEAKIRKLLKEWHPDVSSHARAGEVTAQLNVLAAAARKRVRDGTWAEVGVVSWHSGSRRYRVRYRAKRSFELGTMYYGRGVAAYETKPEHQKLYSNALTRLSTMHWADDKMKTEMSRFLPALMKSFTDDVTGRRVLLLDKPQGTYTVRDVVAARGGRLEPVHAAWLMSGLLNVCCYLQWASLSHGDVSMDTVFMTPAEHSVSLLGGWWYAHPVGEKIESLPYRTACLAPPDSIRMKLADERTDLLCARALVREALGSPSGMDMGGDVPLPMTNFLRSPSSGSALEDYQVWKEKVLPASFGARRFVELEVSEADAFKERA